MQLGIVDKISTFEEFKKERFKDMRVTHDRVMTAQSPRIFRFAGTSNDTPLGDMFASLATMDIDQLQNINIREYLVNAFESMTPDQIKTTVEEIAGMSADYNLKRVLSAAHP